MFNHWIYRERHPDTQSEYRRDHSCPEQRNPSLWNRHDATIYNQLAPNGRRAVLPFIRSLTGCCLCSLLILSVFVVSPSAEAAPFVWIDPTGATPPGFSAPYTPDFNIRAAGSLWTVHDKTTGDVVGHFTVGDRNRASDAIPWNPTLSTRAFNIFGANGANDFFNNPIINHDVVPRFNPDIRDADPTWQA